MIKAFYELKIGDVIWVKENEIPGYQRLSVKKHTVSAVEDVEGDDRALTVVGDPGPSLFYLENAMYNDEFEISKDPFEIFRSLLKEYVPDAATEEMLQALTEFCREREKKEKK